MHRERNGRPRLARTALAVALAAGAATLSGTAAAGGMMLYEVGTADVGLASAGYGARAQDASTVLTNPAGMTRLDNNQFLGAAQLLWGNPKFSIGSATSSALGTNDGGYAIGHGGWFPGGGAFASYTVSPDVKLGFAIAGTTSAA
jgi:long-chain fatty acid transport protein